MNCKLVSSLLCVFTALALSAQVETLPAEIQKKYLDSFQAARQENSPLKAHLDRMAKKPDKMKINAARVAADFKGWPVYGDVIYYSVPAMSETQYLPDVYPFDGDAADLTIIAAQNEYEPGSFLLYPLKDLGKVQFEVSDLKAKDGTVFAKQDLDLKVIKVWYQNGNGWYSYFQDNGLKLCPELLLNDEDLIKVDTKRVANYARLTEKDGSVSYRWLTVNRPVDNRIEDAPGYRLDESFCCMKPNFTDADTFKGATLNEGEFKQFFLTAHVKKGQKPGLYSGSIRLTKDGKSVGEVPVKLRVLPFELPKPKAYLNPEKNFYAFMCEYVSLELIRQINGNDPVLARKQLVSLLKNFVAHNEVAPSFREAFSDPEIAREAGMDLSMYYTGNTKLTNLAEMRYDARRRAEEHDRKLGRHEGYFLSWGDEYGLGILRGIRPMVEIYKAQGFRFAVNSRHGYAAGANISDLYWPPVNPDFSSHLMAEKMNAVDGYFGWYACQHVGVENPAFIRRQYGLGAYRAGFSCHFNYAHHLNGYNDLRGDTYKSMNFVYGDGNGVIDTLAWEAFREGMDDIRYATLLLKLANSLKNSKDVQTQYAAKKALQYLADMNTDDFDLTTARLEMTRHILKLQSLSK